MTPKFALIAMVLLISSCVPQTSSTEVPMEALVFAPINYDTELSRFCTTIDHTMRNIVVTNEQQYRETVHRIMEKGYERYRQVRPNAAETFEEYTQICDTFPEIDFTQKTLLGTFSSADGCGGDDEFVRKVTRDDEQKRILFSITEKNTGTDCAMLIMGMNFVLIPAIPSDYIVFFGLA